MSRTAKLFREKTANILSIYCTAGFPQLENTLPIIRAIQDSGADMVELGMPYSDPLADGPVIQSSGSVAITNGMTIHTLFEQLKDLRKDITLPVILMGYMNPVLQYGFEKFCADAAAAGVDGLILPDLPVYEFEKTYGTIIKRYGLDFVFMVTPETSEERVRHLDALSSGFIYAVSSSSTTGKQASLDAQQAYFERLQKLSLKNPVLIGFGIRDKASFDAACRYANGAIIGTAFIQSIEKESDPVSAAARFVKAVRGN